MVSDVDNDDDDDDDIVVSSGAEIICFGNDDDVPSFLSSISSSFGAAFSVTISFGRLFRFPLLLEN